MYNNLNEFLEEIQSVTIHSLDENSLPFSSYAPYLKYENKYYVFISEMAKHTHNLRANKKCSLFFSEDENTCKNIFAKKRAMFQCEAKQIEKQTDFEKEVLDKFEEKFGSIIETLRKMQDFYLFEFKPFYGEAVFGFGKAYTLSGEFLDQFEQRDTQGKAHK